MSYVNEAVKVNCTVVERNDLQVAYDNGLDLAKKVFKEDKLISSKEHKYLMKRIRAKSIPSLKIRIKDHKPIINGMYKVKLIIPYTNYLSGFSKLAYEELKKVFEVNNVQFNNLLKDSYETKRFIGELTGLVDCKLVSLDVKDIYPSISFNLIRQAIRYFMKNYKFTKKDKKIVEACLEVLKFGMYNIFARNGEVYYKYTGKKNCSLCIGAYEASWQMW